MSEAAKLPANVRTLGNWLEVLTPMAFAGWAITGIGTATVVPGWAPQVAWYFVIFLVLLGASVLYYSICRRRYGFYVDEWEVPARPVDWVWDGEYSDDNR